MNTKQLIIIVTGVCVGIGLITSLILFWPKDTPEQIIAKEQAKQAELDAQHKRSLEDQAMALERQRIDASRPAAAQAADEIGGSIESAAGMAAGAAIGGILLNHMLSQ